MQSIKVIPLGLTGSGKSTVLNTLIGHSVLPLEENGEGDEAGCTKCIAHIDLVNDCSVKKESIALGYGEGHVVIPPDALQHALKDRFSQGDSRVGFDEVYIKLFVSDGAKFGVRLIDIPGLDTNNVDASLITEIGSHDSIFLVTFPASGVLMLATSEVLKIAKELDPDGMRSIGVLTFFSKAEKPSGVVIDQVKSLLKREAHPSLDYLPWIAIHQTDGLRPVKVEKEMLQEMLVDVPYSCLGRNALWNKMNIVKSNILIQPVRDYEKAQCLLREYAFVSDVHAIIDKSIAFLYRNKNQIKHQMDKCGDGDEERRLLLRSRKWQAFTAAGKLRKSKTKLEQLTSLAEKIKQQTRLMVFSWHDLDVLVDVLDGKEFCGELVPAEGVTSQRILERVAAVRRHEV